MKNSMHGFRQIPLQRINVEIKILRSFGLGLAMAATAPKYDPGQIVVAYTAGLHNAASAKPKMY